MNKRLSVKSQYGSPLQHDLNIGIITITNNSRLFNTVKSPIVELVSLSLYKRIGKKTKLNHLFFNPIIFCCTLNILKAATYLKAFKSTTPIKKQLHLLYFKYFKSCCRSKLLNAVTYLNVLLTSQKSHAAV